MTVSTIPAATFAASALGPPFGATASDEARTANPDARDTPSAIGGASGGPTLPEFKHYALSFRVEKETNRIVVQVIDSETKQVVRSVPPEDVVRALRHAGGAPGALVDAQA